MRGQVNGLELQNPNAISRLLSSPHVFEGRARILNVTPGDGSYQVEFDGRGWRYTIIIKKKRPHFEWVEHYLKRGWVLTGARVLIAATLRHDVECSPGVYKLILWQIALKDNKYHFTDVFSGVMF